MRDFLVSAAHLFLGAECAVCGSPAWGICDRCLADLDACVPFRLRRSGLPIPVLAANDYRPHVEKLVPVFKDDGALHLSGVLSRRLALAVAGLQPTATVCLVPVPSLSSAVRRRGSDHAAVLAAGAARRLGLRWLPLITRTARGLDQRSLGARGRQLNVAGSMTADWHGAPVIIVDDVCTTGASLVEAARALFEARVHVIGGAVVGDADRRGWSRERAFHPGSPRS